MHQNSKKECNNYKCSSSKYCKWYTENLEKAELQRLFDRDICKYFEEKGKTSNICKNDDCENNFGHYCLRCVKDCINERKPL
jgi:hypothetical protein